MNEGAIEPCRRGGTAERRCVAPRQRNQEAHNEGDGQDGAQSGNQQQAAPGARARRRAVGTHSGQGSDKRQLDGFLTAVLAPPDQDCCAGSLSAQISGVAA